MNKTKPESITTEQAAEIAVWPRRLNRAQRRFGQRNKPFDNMTQKTALHDSKPKEREALFANISLMLTAFSLGLMMR